MAKKLSEYEIAKQRGITPEEKETFYGQHLVESKYRFKKYITYLMYVVGFLVLGLLCLIKFGTDVPSYWGARVSSEGVHPGEETRVFMATLPGILCLLVAAAALVAAILPKFKQKTSIIVLLALNLAFMCAVMFVGFIDGNALPPAVAILALMVVDLIGLIKMTKKVLKPQDGVKGFAALLPCIFAAAFSINAVVAVKYSMTLMEYSRNFSAASLLAAILLLVFYLLAMFAAQKAYKAANICKEIKGGREDGTKRIYKATLPMIVQLYSIFVFIYLAAIVIGSIAALVGSANGVYIPGGSSKKRTAYSDGQNTFYVEGETIFDDRGRGIGRVIAGKVYDNEMNQTGYISGDKILPL